METIALGVYVTKHTDQAAWTGTVAAAAFLPIAFFSPIGGALADRFPRKLLLIVDQPRSRPGSRACSRCCSSSAIRRRRSSRSSRSATASAAALGFPSFQAMLPDLVPVEDLPGAIALSSAQYNLGRVVGSGARGRRDRSAHRTDRTRGPRPSTRSASSRSSPCCSRSRCPPPSAHARGERFFRSIADGFRFVRREPGLRITALAMCLNTFLAAPFIALVPAMAVKVLHSGSGGTAVLITAQGIGAVVMAFSLGSLVERYRPRRVLVTLMATLPFALVAYALRTRPRARRRRALRRRRRSTSARSRASRRSRSSARRRDPRPRARGEHGDPRLAVPARRGHPGQDRRPHRPARDDVRRGRAHGASCSLGARLVRPGITARDRFEPGGVRVRMP